MSIATQAKIAPSLVEITGRFITERFRFESRDPSEYDTIIADIHIDGTDGETTIKGRANVDELTSNMQYRFFGKWSNYKNTRTGKTEKQFHFNSFVRVAPVGREAIIAYLCHHGRICGGIGKVRAAALYDAFGVDAVEVARTDPDRVSEALAAARLYYQPGKAVMLQRSLQEEHSTEAIKLDLITLLDGRGFPKSLTDTVIAKWGNKAANIIRRDPFKLLKFKSCGFKRCDSMWIDLGLNPARLKRQALCAWYSIDRDTDGHTWFNWKTPDALLQANVAGYDLRKALSLAVRAKLLAEIRTDGESGPMSARGECCWYALYENAKNERDIADAVLTAESEQADWPSLDGLNITQHQKEKLQSALRSSIAILGGSPGTGKTWTVAELVKSLADQVGLSQIMIGGPTGKSSVRVTENFVAKGIDLRARTWASFQMQLEREFLRYFNAAVIGGDEASMNDLQSVANIMRARPANAKLLLVGDVHQLPPVGTGAPLRDLIAAGVAYGELTEIMRNSGGIVETCAAIRDQKGWSGGDNLQLVETKDNHLGEIEWLLNDAKTTLNDERTRSMDPVWDVQIVTAVNEKSQLGRIELNKKLQAFLNKQPGIEGVPFRVGDKLVNTKNATFKSLTLDDFDGELADEHYVANGELAKVVSVSRSELILELEAASIDGNGGASVILVGIVADGGEGERMLLGAVDYDGEFHYSDSRFLPTSLFK